MIDCASALRALDELEKIQADLGRISERTDDARRRDLVQLRRAASAQIALIGQLAEPLFADAPADHAEFRRLFSSMRSAVALHQAEWPAVRLDTGDEQFQRSSQNVRTANRTFVVWLRGHLQDLRR